MSEPAAPPVKGSREPRRYLVQTVHADVVVTVNADAGGLDDDLLSFEAADAENVADLTMSTPLTAFAAKVVDLIELQGTDDFGGSPKLLEMLIKEKATFELRRLGRFAEALASRGD